MSRRALEGGLAGCKDLNDPVDVTRAEEGRGPLSVEEADRRYDLSLHLIERLDASSISEAVMAKRPARGPCGLPAGDASPEIGNLNPTANRLWCTTP